MARKTTERTRIDHPTDFNNVIKEICKGEYVLIVGSEIVLEPDFEESGGDSTRYLLNNIIETRNEKNRKDKKGGEYTPVNTISDFIRSNYLNPKDVKRWILEEIKDGIDFLTDEMSKDLCRLIRSKFFRTILTTTIDPYLEKLMEEVWGKGNFKVMSIYNTPSSTFDISRSDLDREEYFDSIPTLYYVFGKADPEAVEREFVYDDNSTMNCISKWLDEKSRPENLLSFIDRKKLMVLGCNLKDWCFRFFWYAMRQKKDERLGNGDIAVYLDKKNSEQDRNLHDYLKETIQVSLQTNPREYLKRLADSLDETILLDEAVSASQSGGVFISYAKEDFAIALKIFNRLDEAGFHVWFDNRKLKGGDNFNERIENAISGCKVFLTLLSSTVAKELKAESEGKKLTGEPRFYRKEWKKATEPNSKINYIPVVVTGYDPKEAYHKLTPPQFHGETVPFDWNQRPFEELKDLIINAPEKKGSK